MAWYGRKPERPTRSAHAPRCSWPAGCRNSTWDLAGRCPHHRGATTAGQTPPAAAAAGTDPFASPGPTVAQQLIDTDGRLDQRVAVILADRGVTPATLAIWQEAAGRDNETLVAALDSGVTDENLHYFTFDEDREADGYWGHELPLRVYAYWDGEHEPARQFHVPSIIEWREAEPDLGARPIRRLIDGGWTPTDEHYLAYTAVGIPPAEVLDWEAAKIDPAAAGTWHRLGVTPKDAAETQSYGRTADQIAEAAGSCPDDYLPADAAQWRRWKPAERAELWAAGVTAADADDYRNANITGVVAGQLARVGVTASDYRKWRRGPGSPRSGNLHAGDIVRLVDAGATLVDAAEYHRYKIPAKKWLGAAQAGAVGDELLPTLLTPGSSVRQTVISSPNLAPAILARLVAASDPTTAELAAANPSCSPAALERAVTRGHARDAVLRGASRHPDATPATLTAAATSTDPAARVRTATHPNTPPAALVALAADTDPTVRAAATRNPNTPNSGKSAAGLLAD